MRVPAASRGESINPSTKTAKVCIVSGTGVKFKGKTTCAQTATKALPASTIPLERSQVAGLAAETVPIETDFAVIGNEAFSFKSFPPTIRAHLRSGSACSELPLMIDVVGSVECGKHFAPVLPALQPDMTCRARGCKQQRSERHE